MLTGLIKRVNPQIILVYKVYFNSFINCQAKITSLTSQKSNSTHFLIKLQFEVSFMSITQKVMHRLILRERGLFTSITGSMSDCKRETVRGGHKEKGGKGGCRGREPLQQNKPLFVLQRGALSPTAGPAGYFIKSTQSWGPLRHHQSTCACTSS